MPIYEYHCNACDTDFEAWQKITETSSDCEACGSSDTRRKVSATSFVLKGSGWYKTDYASTPAKPVGEKSGSAESPASSPEKTDKAEKSEAPAKTEAPAPKAAAAS
ncbi:MAG: hypothetical protein AMXMBFR64_47570 [Myxococcales bacterium]